MLACARQHYSFGIFAICTSAPSHLCMPAGPDGLPALLAPQVVQAHTEGAAHRNNTKCLTKWLSI